MNRLLSIQEAADILNIKVCTLYAWVHRKKIAYVKVGGKLAFIEDQLNEFIIKNNFIPEY